MTKKKTAFLFYEDWMHAVDEMPPEERLRIYEAIMCYAFTGEVGDTLPAGEKAVFKMAKPFIDHDREEWENTVRKRSEAGKRSGEVRKMNKADSCSTKPTDNVNDNVNENVNVNVNVNENENVIESKVCMVQSPRFAPPALQEVKDYIIEKGYAFTAESFYDFYESKGWMVGRNKMKDWRAAVRNWQRGETENRFNNYGNHEQSSKAQRAADAANVIARIRSKKRVDTAAIWG